MATQNISANSAELNNQQSTSQVRLQLSTRNTDISLPENPGPILVNTSFRRWALSTLVNTLLQSEKQIPFDFLINGNFLRTSLDEYLTANGISSETTLAVEYVRAVIPPLYIASFKHDDWVSSVDVLSESSPVSKWVGGAGVGLPGNERIVSGSYDGLLRVWNPSSEVLATSPSAGSGGHTSSIKASKFLSPTQLVSSGLDRTIRVWKYVENPEELTASIAPQIELYGHKASVDSIAVHQPSSRLLSASADHSIGFWSTKKSDAPAIDASFVPSATSRIAKRRKLGPATSTPQRGPLVLLRSHTAPVSDTIFAPNDHTFAYSSSWDHNVKTWDLPTSTCVDTRSTSHSLLSLTALSTLNLLAVGTSARNIKIIDPRVSATTVSAMTLRGHSNAVISLAADPESEYCLVSGSHDGICRIWDVRSSKHDKERYGESVYCIERESTKGQSRKVGGEGSKIFGVCWDKNIGIVSAGEDKRVQINKGKGIIGERPP